jgi:hypothetical protein
LKISFNPQQNMAKLEEAVNGERKNYATDQIGGGPFS